MREGKALVVGAGDGPNAAEFFARVLLNGTRLLLRRGLERGYRATDDELSTLRGRVLLGPSYRKMLLQQGKAVCSYDELGHDTLNNQIVKATLECLCKVTELDRELRFSIFDFLSRFEDVASIRLAKSDFQKITVHRNNSYYDLVLKLCELIHGQLFPIEHGSRFRFANVIDNETRMSAVFEEFVRVFYQTELREFDSVKREDIRWDAVAMDDLHASYLPKMQTDVTLRSKDRTIIVDAKFYKSVFSAFRGSEKIYAANLYQMFSYLRNSGAANFWPRPEGLLLYPSSSESVTLDYELGGHGVRIATVDLHVEWRKIEERLRQLVTVSQQSIATA
jgi:5-methylcytosine-specific restriction enzyme subunit McrC